MTYAKQIRRQTFNNLLLKIDTQNMLIFKYTIYSQRTEFQTSLNLLQMFPLQRERVCVLRMRVSICAHACGKEIYRQGRLRGTKKNVHQNIYIYIKSNCTYMHKIISFHFI